MKEKPKKPRGRPKVEINLKEAEKLGMLHCTLEECSAWLNVQVSTLSMRPDFLEAFKRGQQNGKMSLRRMQLRAAENGNTALLIFLGKNLLGQTDKPEETQNTQEKLIAAMKAIAEKM